MNYIQTTRVLRGSIIAAALFALSSFSGTAIAQGNSPVGYPWDFVITGGGQQGIAVITFSVDPDNPFHGTLSGREILVPSAKKLISSDRNAEGDPGRGTGTNAPATTTNVFVYGYSDFTGDWSYDSKGRVIGNFTITLEDEGTNVTYQGISFVGKVVPGKRFNLLASTPQGKINYRGVPYRDLPNLRGSWNGFKKAGKQSFVEFLALFPEDLNTYSIPFGIGPAYVYDGLAMVSAQKKMAFAFREFPEGETNWVLRASAGSFNSKKNAAKTKGFMEPDVRFGFSATRSFLDGQ